MNHFLSKLKYSIFLASFLFGAVLNAQNSNKNNFKKEHPKFVSKFEEQTIKIFKNKGLEGDFLFAVVNENGLVYSFALNNEILAGQQSSLDNDSPIYIASTTKAFTGTLLKILEEKGKLDLDKSLAYYLPKLNFGDSIATEKINLRSLLNHTGGFYSTPMVWKTAFLGYGGKNSELIHDLNTDFLHDSSRVFRYSNAGPILAAIVAEKVTGSSWKHEMEKYIFQPLEMGNTSAYVSDFEFEEIRPSVLVSKENGIVETDFYKQDITMHASGGIISTVNDLSKWLSANIQQDEILLSMDSWPDLHTTTTVQDREYFTYHRTGYSLGWDIADYNGDPILTRFGSLAGIMFHCSFMPEKNIGIIAFSSDSRAFLLPHLMADYAYNLLNSKSVDSIFEIEKSIFIKAFNKENAISYPRKDQLLTANSANDKICGNYQSTTTWPIITIEKKDNYYIFNWGVANGKVYKTEEGFISNLGVMQREFAIKNDTLKTGSLIYIKKEG